MNSPVIAYRPELHTHQEVQRNLDRLRASLDEAAKVAIGLGSHSTREEIAAADRALWGATGALHWLLHGVLPGER